MEIRTTTLTGVHIIKRNIFEDERGYFSRLADVVELKNAGLNADFVQVNLSQNHKKGVLRGLHSQKAEFAEDKLITCIHGAIFDVCVDVREGSPTFGQSICETLSDENGLALYVPKGCAHGYIALTDESKAMYFVTQFYTPDSEVGYRWNDPAFVIPWPIIPTVISAKDASWPLLYEKK